MINNPTPVDVHVTAKRRLPWHGWLFALTIIFIYINGAWDFVNTMTVNVEYMQSKGFASGAEAYFTDYPIIFMLLFAINILSAILAAFLLLWRSKWTEYAALIALVSMMILEICTFTFRDRWNALGSFVGIFDLFLLGITATFYAYCVIMRRKVSR